MTDLCLESIDTLSLLDFQPPPIPLLKRRCQLLCRPSESSTLDDENLDWARYDVSSLSRGDALRLLALVLRRDEQIPGEFDRWCESGAIPALLSALNGVQHSSSQRQGPD